MTAALGTTTSTISSAPAALATKNARSLASISARAEVDGSTKTSRAPRSSRIAAADSVSASNAAAVRVSRRTTSHAAVFSRSSLDTPSSSDAAREIPTIVTASRYSRMDGASPAASRLGTAAVTALRSEKATRRVEALGRAGASRSVTSVTSARVPSEPMTSWVRS